MRLAGLQRRLVVREQLLDAGLGRGAIVHRLATGRIRELYRGVYLVGPGDIDPLVRELAAVLYFRGHAILSHHSAAAVWGLLERTAHGEVSLTTRAKARRSRPGLRLHRVNALDRRDLRTREGLPAHGSGTDAP